MGKDLSDGATQHNLITPPHSIPVFKEREITLKEKMKILNYGAGAVGLGLDSCLLKAGEDIDMVARPKTVAALNKNGLIRRGIFGNFKASPKMFNCYASLDKVPAGAYDFILVTTKSFDSKEAAKDIARHPKLFHSQTRVVLCQNGWGNAEIFASSFPKKQIYNMRIITGFTRPKPNEVTMTVHADSILIGSLFGGELKYIEKLCRAITKGGIPCRLSPDIGKDLWAKMLYNCALNSLGAIFEVPYGVLGQHEFSRDLMNEIIREAFLVMKKSGHKTHWPSANAYLKVFYRKFLPKTAKHNSSTLQDIKAKKRTEIDALNGMIVNLAERLKIPSPVNRLVYKIVKFIELRNVAEGLTRK